jgi:hypothetical protein
MKALADREREARDDDRTGRPSQFLTPSIWALGPGRPADRTAIAFAAGWPQIDDGYGDKAITRLAADG